MGEADPGAVARLRAWFEVAQSQHPSAMADSAQVLYLSDPGDRPQAFRVPIDGGTSVLVTPVGTRISAIFASPTGPRAMVAYDEGGDENWQLSLLEDATANRPTPVRLTREDAVKHVPGRWRDDGARFVFTSNARDRRFFDVYELDVRRPGDPAERLVTQDATLDVIDAKGENVLVGRANTNLDIDLFLRQGGQLVHLNPHAGEETVFSAAIAGDAVLAAANPGREYAALVRYRAGRSSHEYLREYPGDVEIVEPAPDGRRVLLGVNRDGWTELHLYDPSTGEDRPMPTSPKGVIERVSWVPDGTAFVHDLSSVEGTEVYRRMVETGKSRRITTSARPVPERIAEPKLGSFAASDRVPIPYWEFLPKGPPQGTIVQVHGGPESQARPRLLPFVGYLVADGWRVVLPNVRGSTGYGRRYLHLDDVRLRMDSVRDVRELVDHLVRRGAAERGRVGLLGGSYGGFVVLSSLATYPETYGAGVDIVGIANFVTFLTETAEWRRPFREAEYGRLDRDREFLESISPLHHAEKIRAPLLVIHGRNDPRVPVHEAEQMVETLRGLGRPVELIVFDDEGHGVVGRANRERAYGRAAAFFAEHLGTTAGKP
jgi:dipeptidyl aminopeptidase/acylaminoacyl peptidase